MATRPQWIKQKKAAVFKQAINEEDRHLVYRENQSRSIAGLPDMNLSQMVDYLIKTYSEQNAFTTASHLKHNPRHTEVDSLQTLEEKRKTKFQKRKDKKEALAAKKASEEQKLKDDLFAFYEQGKPFYNNKGKARGNRGNGRNGYNNQGSKNNTQFVPNFPNQKFNFSPNNRGGNGWKGSKKNTQPRKFVTPEMVNVAPNSCLKCNSPAHRFQEQDKCIYGKTNLMTRACPNCKEGGHHFNVCIKNQKPTIGAQEPQSQEPRDQNFSKWPDMTKNVPEMSLPFGQQKNSWIPSLFPN